MKITKKNSKYVILNQRGDSKIYGLYDSKEGEFRGEGSIISVYNWEEFFFDKGYSWAKPPYDQDQYIENSKYILNRIKTRYKINGKIFFARVGSKKCPIILTDYIGKSGRIEYFSFKQKS